MKRFTKKSIALYVTFAILIVFLTGAECTIGGCSVTFNDYTAKAVNIKAADSTTGFYKDSSTGISLVGAEVSLYAYNDTTGSYSATADYTADVENDGTFTFYSPISNRYKLTATATDWIFVPQYIEITNNGAAVKDLYAFPKTGAGEYTIVASWENIAMDVDLTLTYGPAGETTTNLWETGDTYAVGERLRIGYGNLGSSACITHDMDIKADDDSSVSRVETMSIYNASWLNNGDTIKVYLDTAYAADVLTGLEGTEPSAYAQVDLIKYSSGTSEHYGTWYIPWNTYENTIQVMEILYAAGTFTIYSANSADWLYGGNIRSVIWE